MHKSEVNDLFRRLEIISATNEFISKNAKKVKSIFFRDRFKTGIIDIPELKLNINLKPNQFYRLEFSDNLFEREVEIQEKYFESVDVRHADRYSLKGLCIPIKKTESARDYNANIILIKNGLNELTQTYVIGHENGHFIFNMGLCDTLYKKYGVSGHTIDEIKDTEDFAMFCGNIAMANAGHKLALIRSNSPNPDLLEKEIKARQLAIDTIPEQFYYQLFLGHFK